MSTVAFFFFFFFVLLLYPDSNLIIYVETFEKQWTGGLLQIPCTYNQHFNTFFIVYHFPFIPLHVSFGDNFINPPRLWLMFFLTSFHPHAICWRVMVQRRGAELCSASCTCLGLDLPIYRQKWAAGISEMSSQGNRQFPLFCPGLCRVVSVD